MQPVGPLLELEDDSRVVVVRAATRAAGRAPRVGANARNRDLGRWLLYSDTDGKLAAIDTAGDRRVIDLTRFVGRLPGIRDPFTAYWSGRSPEL